MSDFFLEILRAIIVGGIFIYLWIAGRKEEIYRQEGWSLILAGFGLIFFGMIIDITDNFSTLNQYILIGDTPYQAFVEKVVGFLFGFILLTIGFWKWMPTVIKLREAEKALKKSHDDLESMVDRRTAELKLINQELQQEIDDRKRVEEELNKYRENLEIIVEKRTQELRKVQKELIGKALDAGRAQSSAMVLHNIGNAITPMKVQVEALKNQETGQIFKYMKNCLLELDANKDDLKRYVTEDPRGREVFSYFGNLVQSADEYRTENKDRFENLDRALSYVAEILSLQQAYAVGKQESRQMVYLNALIEDAICMQHGALERRKITIVKHLDKSIPRLVIDKNRLIQVINNLIKNSYEAIDALEHENREKTIAFKTFSDKRQAGFEIADSGIGIEEEQFNSAFEIGKSSKGSSGFGLYYCKMFVEDNNGQLIFNSPGKGKGAVVRVAFEQQRLAPDS